MIYTDRYVDPALKDYLGPALKEAALKETDLKDYVGPALKEAALKEAVRLRSSELLKTCQDTVKLNPYTCYSC